MRRTFIFVSLACMILLSVQYFLVGDELHKKDGTIVYGLFSKESRGSIKFKEAGSKSTKSYKKENIQRIVFTFSLPEFVYTDPNWSKLMIESRKEQSFDPSWGKVEVLRSKHFIVFTNSDAGKRYLETMEDIYQNFKKTFPFEEPKKAALLPVFLFKTDDQYNRFYAKIANITIAEAGTSAGHACADYYATYYAAPRDSVHYHEGAHQLVENRLHVEGGGSWFQEGLAVYFEGVIFTAEDPAIGMKTLVRQNKHTPLQKMIELRTLSPSSDSLSLVSIRYRQAGAITKFLIEGPDREKFTSVIEAVKAGDAWTEIFQNVYGRTVEEMDQAFVDYYKEYKR